MLAIVATALFFGSRRLRLTHAEERVRVITSDLVAAHHEWVANAKGERTHEWRSHRRVYDLLFPEMTADLAQLCEAIVEASDPNGSDHDTLFDTCLRDGGVQLFSVAVAVEAHTLLKGGDNPVASAAASYDWPHLATTQRCPEGNCLVSNNSVKDL